MPNLQYIGARYVPIVFDNPDDHSANWKSGVSYENLVIVTYLDDSYTSRKPVPSSVGNPADNPQYWAKTGDFNAALTALQNQVNNIDNVEIPALDTRLDRLENKKIIFVTDSYGNRTYNSKTYPALFAERTGITNVYNLQANGAGFTDVNPGADNTFLGELQDNIGNIGNLNDVTDVIVCGGANDYGEDYGDIETAIGDFVAYCKSNLPNARVHIGHIGTNRNNGTSLRTFANYSVLAYRNCSKFGAHYLTGSEIILHDPALLEADLLHPNSNGVDAIATGIINAFFGGRAYKTLVRTIASATNARFAHIYINNYLCEKITDDTVYLRGTANGNIGLEFASTEASVSNIDEIIGEVTGGALILDGENKIVMKLSAHIRSNGNWEVLPDCALTVDGDGKIHFVRKEISMSAFANVDYINAYELGSASIASEEC